MSRKSSIHFKPVSNIRFAVSHSERTDLSEPAYLLPKEHQIDNIIVAGSLSENDLAALFIRQKDGMSRQAKTAGSSPFWEGVMVLANTDGKEQSANLQSWKKEYEKATGHKVLHMSVHLDEGYIDTSGAPQYNPHAHVIVSRMGEKNRVIDLNRKQLAKVQDLTAETLQMERGSTLAERQGKRGRAHVPHREFRAQADEVRLELEKPKADLVRLQKLSKQWSDSDMAKVKDLQAKLDCEPARLDVALKAQEAQLNEKYRLDREAMKATGTATQRAYQALKAAHDGALAELKKTNQKVEKMEKQITQLTDENTKLAADKAKFAAMATAYQAEKAKGTPAHLIAPGAAPAPSNKPEVRNSAPMPPEATKRVQEPPKQPEVPIPSPAPTKSLVELLAASWGAMVGWIKAIGAEQEPVGPSTRHDGPVKHLDDLHCVQKTGRRYAVHRLADLDNVPALDDPQMIIQYRDGKGTVKGRLGKPGVQI